MKFYNYLIIIFFVLTNAALTEELTKCGQFKMTSKEYVKCINDVAASTNTIKNLKEFKKHKTFSSFFKQLRVIETD